MRYTVVVPALIVVVVVEVNDRSCGWRGPVLELLLLVGCLVSILGCLKMGGVDVGEGINPSPSSWHVLGPLLLSVLSCGDAVEGNMMGSSGTGEDIDPSSITSRMTSGWKLIRSGIRLIE